MSTGVVIRLRNLPVSAGTIDIRRFFSTLSIPDGGVHIIGGEDGTAFILFTTDEDARQAMLRDGQKISGDKVKLMLSSHTEMRLMIEESQRRYEELRGLRPPEPPITNLTSRSSATGGGAQKGQAQPDTADTVSDLYCEMKGMPYNVSEEDIVEFFQHLPISAIRFMRDEKGRQSGQGFVKFKSPTSKQQALKKDRDFLGPRFVRVIPATERQWVSSGSQMCDTVRPSTDEYSRKRGQNSTPTNEGTPKRSRALSPIRCDNCVELRGLPVTSSYKTVQDLFYHLKFVEGGLFLELDGKHCRGRAFAEFSTIEEYKEALLKDGEMIEGKQIRVISISRQVMAEQIKQHKKYLKMKREEEYKREREEIEHKERLKERQMKEAQYEEQKRKDEEEQKKRREYQMKKQREMEEWLARQHAKEEEERKRRELDRLFEQRRMQEEEDRARRAALEEKRRREEDELRRKEEAEMRAEFERKRQIELQRLEAKIKEEAEMRIKQEYMKKELESMNQNGNVKEVEMDLEDQNPSPAVPKEEYVEDYPPPPSDALLPVKPATSQYSSASSDSGFSQFSRGSSGTPQLRPGEPPLTSHASVHPYQPMAYQHRFTPPPPLPSPGTTSLNPPALPPSTALPPPSVAPLKLPTAPAVIIAATPPLQMLTSLPPPPLPPSIGLGPVVRLPRAPNPALPPRIPTQTGSVVAPVTLPPPNGRLPPTSSTTEARPPAPQMRPPQPNDPNIPTKFVRIANSPFTISEHMIREFFHGLPIAPHGVQFVIKNGKRSGHIFIKFMHEVDAERASRQDKGHLGGREVLVQKTNPTQMTQLLRKFESRNLEDLFPLSDFAGTATANYKPQPPGGAMGLPPKPSHRDDLNLEMNILVDKLTCVRLGSVPPHTIPEDIMRAFSGISIMPNGIHILHTPDGKCNGNAFVELVTSEDCVRAANLHAVAQIHGSLIRIMPVRNGEMEKEIMDHNMKVFGRPPHGPPLPSNLPPPHPDELRLQMPPRQCLIYREAQWIC
uniref:uncharacterized protein LOC120332795 n=1 Tax=Styela clava TaxID=7725 RepID=UPI00193A22B9|nr:uncharacterized protein LOC120332795 [Styela clava]